MRKIYLFFSVVFILVISVAIFFMLCTDGSSGDGVEEGNMTDTIETLKDGLNATAILDESEVNNWKQHKPDEDTISSISWEDLYLDFITKEKENLHYVVSDFSYAFINFEEIDYPLLLLKDQWNMYLFHTENNEVVAAKDKNGDVLQLHRMSSAYNNNRHLYLYGSIDAPGAFYYCEVKYDGSFYLEYFAEGKYDSEGNVIYHTDGGNVVTEQEHKQEIENRIGNSTGIVFV